MSESNRGSRIVSLNVGKPIIAKYGSKDVETGIFKKPSEKELPVGRTGIEGDGQGDTVHHGGPDKAVCAYFDAHYGYWERWLGRSMGPGAFGENFTLSDWTEQDVCIGDIIQGERIALQVSQPRVPCFKLGLRNDNAHMPAEAAKTGFTGFYFRVLREGTVAPGERLILSRRHPAGVTVAEANRVMHRDRNDLDGIRRLLAVPELADAWREPLSARLARLTEADGGS